MPTSDPSHNDAHDFPLATRLVNDLIEKWLDTATAIELAGRGDLTPEERAARQAIEQMRDLALADYSYALTPKILDHLRRAGLLSPVAT
ncbi:hypothetical protein ACFV1H_19035 [Streptomyces virginiae]|uniref:hypothetical protein n=1 Tax=Streptomyces virginiae TaxID=1961 RepID=UPI0036C78439